MAGESYTYPFDPAGTRTENFISKERHIINPPKYTDYYFVVPFVGPFFQKDLKIVHYPSGRELIEGVDFLLCYQFLSASRATAKPVYGAISFYDLTLSGSIEIDYRTLGGKWTIDESIAAEMLSNVMNNPRITTWEEVVELPESFPVIDHEWDLDDMVGASEIVAELERIRDAILTGPSDGGVSENHAALRNNPHDVTAEQIGLGNVPNNAMATLAQAQTADSNLAFMSPLRTKQLIDALVMGTINDHIADQENPHNVTKAQVGLSKVNDYATATEVQARDAVATDLYVTPAGVLAAIHEHVGEGIGDHVSNQENPHNVTKAQVSLGNVPNYNMATEATALEGTSQSNFVSPYLVSAMIADQVANAFSAHASNTDNPHSVTKTQVGLSNVDNFSTADEIAARQAQSVEMFMTPLATSQQIDELVGQDLSEHVGNTQNPHNVTKDQVGLSDVANYSVANVEQALAASSQHYATPSIVQTMLQGLVFPQIADIRSDLEAWTETMVASIEDANRRLDGEEVFRITSVVDYGYPILVGSANYFAADGGRIAKFDGSWTTITSALVDNTLDVTTLSTGRILTIQENGTMNIVLESDGSVSELTNPRTADAQGNIPLPVTMHATEVDQVFVTFDDNQTWMTDDVGTNWVVVSDGAEFIEVNQVSTIAGQMHLATDSGLFTYDGNTLTLDQSFASLELPDTYISAFIGGINDANRLICPGGKTFIYYKDGEWLRFSEDLELADVIVHDGVWVGIAPDGKLYRSYDQSTTWHQYRPDGEDLLFNDALSQRAYLESLFIATDGSVYTTIDV